MMLNNPLSSQEKRDRGWKIFTLRRHMSLQFRIEYGIEARIIGSSNSTVQKSHKTMREDCCVQRQQNKDRSIGIGISAIGNESIQSLLMDILQLSKKWEAQGRTTTVQEPIRPLRPRSAYDPLPPPKLYQRKINECSGGHGARLRFAGDSV